MDGVVYTYCERVGCHRLLGATRYEGNKVVEEEFYPDATKDEEGKYYCEECLDKKDIFKGPEEIADE